MRPPPCCSWSSSASLADNKLAALVIGSVALLSSLAMYSWLGARQGHHSHERKGPKWCGWDIGCQGGPFIAVFPFNNEVGKPEHNALIRGLPAHIIHALTRYRDLFILAPDTTLAIDGDDVQNLEKARRLNASYILSGGFLDKR